MKPKPKELKSTKKYRTAVILSAIFGVMGIHHFYVGRWIMGLFDLGLFIATLIAWFEGNLFLCYSFFIIDLTHTIYVTTLLLIGQYKDGQGRLICYPKQKLNK